MTARARVNNGERARSAAPGWSLVEGGLAPPSWRAVAGKRIGKNRVTNSLSRGLCVQAGNVRREAAEAREAAAAPPRRQRRPPTTCGRAGRARRARGRRPSSPRAQGGASSRSRCMAVGWRGCCRGMRWEYGSGVVIAGRSWDEMRESRVRPFDRSSPTNGRLRVGRCAGRCAHASSAHQQPFPSGTQTLNSQPPRWPTRSPSTAASAE